MIKAIEFKDYSVPFKSPLQVGKELLSRRNGLIIESTDNQGNKGLGEIAPLKGYSLETLAEAKEQITSLSKSLPLTIVDILETQLLPSVRFGLETAFFYSAIAPGKLPPVVKQHVGVNGLLHPNLTILDSQVAKLLEQGFETIKIKVGRRQVEEDIRIIKRVAAITVGSATVRLDANRLWDFEQAATFGAGIGGIAIEYIEEPFSAIQRIPEFFNRTGIPVALDESLWMEPGLEIYKNIPYGVKALILKPTMLGGLLRTFDFIAFARQQALKPVISSCFETGAGFAALKMVAASIDFDNSACGLDTLKYFHPDTGLVVNPNMGFVSLDTGSIISPEKGPGES